MLSIKQIAMTVHEANRALCAVLTPDMPGVPWSEAPEWQKKSAMLGVAGIIKGDIKNPGDSHVSWREEKIRDGWIYGPVKDAEKKTHPCMVDFSDLPKEQQVKDHVFFSVVKSMLGLTPPKIWAFSDEDQTIEWIIAPSKEEALEFADSMFDAPDDGWKIEEVSPEEMSTMKICILDENEKPEEDHTYLQEYANRVYMGLMTPESFASSEY